MVIWLEECSGTAPVRSFFIAMNGLEFHKSWDAHHRGIEEHAVHKDLASSWLRFSFFQR